MTKKIARFARVRVADGGYALAPATPGRQLRQRDAQLKRVARDHWAAKAIVVDATEQRQQPRVARVSEEGTRAELRERLRERR